MVVYMAIYMVVYMVMDTYMIYIYIYIDSIYFFCIYIQYIDINFKHSKKKLDPHHLSTLVEVGIHRHSRGID